MHHILQTETNRQLTTMNLIASENFPSIATLSALSSRIQSKYAEGHPQNRYYQGCEIADQVEILAEKQLKKLTKTTKELTVQAISGSIANLAAYNSVLSPGDKILALKLNQGGHLSHGSSVSLTSKVYNFQHYSKFDLNQIEKRIAEFRPKMLVVGYSAYPRDLPYQQIKEICVKHNVHLHGDVSHNVGLILSGVNNDPFQHCDSVMFTTHKTFRGPRGAVLIGDGVKKSVFPGIQGGPFMNNIAGIAQAAIEAGGEEFKDKNARIKRFSKEISQRFDKKELFTGGTDMHYFILRCEKQVEIELRNAGIMVNQQKIGKENGIRIGFPFIIHQGATDEQMQQIGDIIEGIVRGAKGIQYKPYVDEIMREISARLIDRGEV